MTDAELQADLRKKGFVRNGDGSYSQATPAPVVAGLSDAKPERPAGPALDKTPQGEAASCCRVKVVLTRKSTRLLDLDNLAGSFKFLIDALRGQRYIANDDPASVRLEFAQEKVKTRKEAGTEILIEVLPDVG